MSPVDTTIITNITDVIPEHEKSNEHSYVVFQRMTSVARFSFAVVLATVRHRCKVEGQRRTCWIIIHHKHVAKTKR